ERARGTTRRRGAWRTIIARIARMPKLKTCAAAAAALAACAMLQAVAAAPASLRAATASALDAFLHKAVNEGRVPAAVAVVASADRVLYLHAAGTRDVAAGAALEPDAIFRIASMTKPITSAVVMMLRDEGRLDVEKISDGRLEEVLKARVFDPLGMEDTFYAVPEGKRGRVVTLHTRVENTLREQPNPAAPRSNPRGDGGLFSTAGDYARFMQLFLNGGRAGGRRVLSEASVKQMLANQIGALFVERQPSADLAHAQPFPFGGGKDKFGFGFQIEGRPATPGLRSAGSASWGGINNTHFWIDPQKQIAVAVLMQFLPYYDPAALDVLRGCERIVYEQRN